MNTLKVLPLSLVFITVWLMTAAAVNTDKKVLKVTGLSVCPFFCGVDQNGVAKGVDMDVLRIVAQKINYSIEFEVSRGFSTVLNGTAIGPVGQVFNGSVQVAVGHVPILYMFNDFVDFSSPLYASTYLLMSSKPRSLPQHWNLLKPFTFPVWSLIIMTTFFAWMTQMVLNREKELGFWQNLLSSYLIVAGMALQQCQNWDYRSSKSKLIFISSWLIFSALIWSGYESLLQASLISVDFERPIETANDVLAKNAPFYYVQRRALNDLMRTSSKKAYREVMARAEKEKNHLKPSPTEGYNSAENMGILAKRKAVTVVMDKMFPFVALLGCTNMGYNPFRLGSEVLYVSYAAFGLPKNSTLTGKFEQVMPYVIASGLVDKAFSNNMPLFHNINTNIDEGNDVPLEMDHFVVGLGFLTLGLLLACIIFLLEIGSYKSEELKKETLFLKTHSVKKQEMMGKFDQ